MEQRKPYHDVATVPALDVSMRVATPLAVSAPKPDARLPDVLAFDLVYEACRLAVTEGAHRLAWRGTQSLLRRTPEALATSYLFGMALLAGNQVALAIQQFQLVLQRNPTDSEAWQGLTQALQVCQQPKAAVVTQQRAHLNCPLASNGLPSEAAALVPAARGVILLKRGMPELAATELLNTLRTTPPRSEIQLYYIEALRRSGRLDEAQRLISHFDVELEPALPVLWLRAALSDSDDIRRVTLAAIHDMDPDGRATRAFFAPLAPPWDSVPQPSLSWDQDLVALSDFLLRADAVQAKSTPLATTAPATRPDPQSSSPKPPVRIVAHDDQVHMIVAHRQALVRRFGHGGWQTIDTALQKLVDVLNRNGMTVRAGYIDDPHGLRIGDVHVSQPVAAEAMAIRDMVRSLSQQLKAHGAELATLLLLGGDDCIPFHRLQNPIPDDELAVMSDNPYACDDAGYLIPQRIVSRIPTGEGDNPELVLQVLTTMTEYHTTAAHQGQIGFDISAWLRIRGAAGDSLARGIAAEVWREPAAVVLQNLHPDAKLLSSPPLIADAVTPKLIGGREILYINLHGASGMAGFYGQSENSWGAASALPVVLLPDQLTRSVIAGSMIISEACYGAELSGRTPANSIALRALANGAVAFVGATVNAYGSASTPLLGADLLFERLTSHLANGVPIGMALHFARLEFAQIMYERQGFLDDVDMKTLIEFILLGNPWATLKGNVRQPSIRLTTQHGTFKVVAVERVPKVLRRMALHETDVSPTMLQQAKRVIRKYLPADESQRLSIMATTNPYYQAKGVFRPDVRVSSKAMLTTADGNFLPRNIHLTMHDNALVKMVLSR